MAELAELIPTKAEFEAMLNAADLSVIASDKAQAAAYYDHVFGAISAEVLETNEVLTQTLLSALRGPPDPVALQAARDLGARQTRQIWGNLARSELNKIGQVIRKGVLDGRGPREVARRLQTVTSLDPQRAARLQKVEAYLRGRGLSSEAVEQQTARFKAKLVRDRRETIAITEMRDAVEAGNLNAAKSQGDNWKAWLTTGDQYVSQEICAPNEEQGWILIDASFQSGHGAPPGHPECACNLATRAASPSEAGQKRAKRRSDRTQNAIENPRGATSRQDAKKEDATQRKKARDTAAKALEEVAA